MTKQEIIAYMYENHVQGDFKIEEMAEDLSQKIGKWIEPQDHGCVTYSSAYAECDQCHSVTFFGATMNFCPNCGSYNAVNHMENKE